MIVSNLQINKEVVIKPMKMKKMMKEIIFLKTNKEYMCKPKKKF